MTTRRKPARAASSEALPALFEHRFRRPELLTLALTHRSLAYESNPDAAPSPTADNEQLEFVGDAVLGLAVADSLFRRFPYAREGELTRLRASLVSRRHLGCVAERIGLGSLLRLGRGEEQSGGRKKPALLANALEAVIAALYLDGGLDAARPFIERHIIEPSIPDLHGALSAGDTFSGAIGDHKSALQEYLQAAGAGQPQYVLTAQSGPDHQKLFRVEVRIPDGNGGSRALAESEGSTKKQAQQQAARIAFERLLAEQKTERTEAEKLALAQPQAPSERRRTRATAAAGAAR
jgi:ribonuclease-3